MALNGILNSSLSGIQTSAAALSITSNNVANVNTEGFARTRVDQSALVLGGSGTGVSLVDTGRIVDSFLEGALLDARSGFEQFNISRTINDQFQSILGRPDNENSLTGRLDQFFSAVAQLSLTPSDPVARRNALGELEQTVLEINRIANAIQDLRGEVQRRIEEEVEGINNTLRSLAELGPDIVVDEIQGSDVGGLQNALAQELNTLSESFGIRSRPLTGGFTEVATTSGGILLGNNVFAQLSLADTGVVGPSTVFPSIEITRFDSRTGDPIAGASNFEPDIDQGTLAGLIGLRDDTLNDFSIQLGELAARLTREVNAISNSFTAVPAPNELTGSATPFVAGNDANFTGFTTFAVTDASNQVVATTGALDLSTFATIGDLIAGVNGALGGAGTLTLTDGVLSFAAAGATDGVVIQDDATIPSDRAGQGFSQFFGLNNLIDNPSPGIFDNGISTTDTFNDTAGGSVTLRLVDDNNRIITTVTLDTTTIGGTFDDVANELNLPAFLGAFGTFSFTATGSIIFTPAPAFSDAKLQVVSDDTNLANSGITLSGFLGFDEAERANSALEIGISSRVDGDINLFPTAEFDTTALVGDIALGAGDQRGVLALQSLETLAVTIAAAGDLPNQTTSLSEFAASFLANTGLEAAKARAGATDNEALLVEIEQRQSEVSAVNLDEELANLVIFQNAYNASARVLSSVNELFDSLLNAV